MKTNWTVTLLGKLKSVTTFANHDSLLNNLADAVDEIRNNVPSSVNDLTDYTAGGSGTVTSDSITDATTTGKSLITAANAAAVRTISGAGTSNLVLGTTSTTAKAGDYAPAITDVTGLTSALAAKGTVKTVNNISPDGSGNVTVAGGSAADVSWFSERATSTCQTVPFGLAGGSNSITGGTISAGLAINKATRTYSNARFHLVSQTAAPTDVFIGVWNTDGTLIGATGNITLTAGALNIGTFATPVSLTSGTSYFVGISVIGGTAFTILRYAYAGAITGGTATLTSIQPFRISWTMTGNTATSAAPPNLTGTTQVANIPWIDLY